VGILSFYQTNSEKILNFVHTVLKIGHNTIIIRPQLMWPNINSLIEDDLVKVEQM